MELLGFVSASPANTTYTVFDNIIGGNLLPLSKNLIPTPFRCQVCQNVMCFLSQMYCPLTASSRHRVLFFFVCLDSKCQTQGCSWKVFRSEEEVNEVVEQNDNIGGWTLDNDEENGNECQENPPLMLDGVMNNGCCSETASTEKESLSGPFQCHFIDVYDSETQLAEVMDSINDDRKAYNSQFETWLQTYEVDEAFIEEDDNAAINTFNGGLNSYFAHRNACEDIRYIWSGQPIFNGRPPHELAGRLVCPRCGSCRVFELQIFPSINNVLRLRNNADKMAPLSYDLLEGDGCLDPNWLLRFVTVLVFSCSKSCWTSTDSYIEECVVAQTEGGQTYISTGI